MPRKHAIGEAGIVIGKGIRPADMAVWPLNRFRAGAIGISVESRNPLFGVCNLHRDPIFLLSMVCTEEENG